MKRFITFFVFLLLPLFGPGEATSQNLQEVENSAKDLVALIENEGVTLAEIKTEIDALKKQVETLLVPPDVPVADVLTETATLVQKNAKDTSIAAEVGDLRGAVFDYERQNRDAFIQMLAGEVTGLLQEEDVEEPNLETLKALVNLSDAIADKQSKNLKEALQHRVARLNADITQSDPIMDGDVQIDGIGNLRTTLLMLEENYFLTALRDRTTRLTDMVKMNTAALRLRLKASDFTAFAALRGHLDTLIGDKAGSLSGIHVVSATYGRISGPREAGGNCNARATVLNYCQRKEKCTVPRDAFAKLCGGLDPAPFADGNNKGLLVNYLCLIDQPKSAWNGLLNANPESFAGRARSVVLRSEHDAIQCATE